MSNRTTSAFIGVLVFAALLAIAAVKYSGIFVGDGSGLTNLPPATAVSGTGPSVFELYDSTGGLYAFSYGTNRTTAFPAGLQGDGTGLTNSSGFGFADTNWVLNQVAEESLMHLYSTGTTNTGSLAGRTNNWVSTTSPSTITATNSISGLIVGSYIRNVVSSPTFTRVEEGPVAVRIYIARTGNQSQVINLHPEFFLYDTVSNTLPYAWPIAIDQPISGAAPVMYSWSVSGPTVIWTNPVKFVMSWKVGGNPPAGAVLNFISGGSYDSHTLMAQNLSGTPIDASQISGTMTGTTLIPISKAAFYTNYTASASDAVLFCTGTNQIVTLPDATVALVGKMYSIHAATTTSTILVTNATGAQTILGGLYISVPATNHLTVVNNGLAWW